MLVLFKDIMRTMDEIYLMFTGSSFLWPIHMLLYLTYFAYYLTDVLKIN